MLPKWREMGMKRMNGAQVYVIALLMIGLIGAIVSGAWPVRTAFVIIAAVCGYAYYRLDRSGNEEQASQERMKQEQDHHGNVLLIVNRLRHDWMNDIQVLFGYIQLKKYDNLAPYMEKIRVSMHRESLLSKLGIPSLVSYIFTFRVQAKAIQLEIGFEQEISLGELPVQAELIYCLVRDTVEIFNAHAALQPEEVGVLSLEFDAGGDHLLLDFVYQGLYNQEELQRAVRHRLLRDSGDFQVETHHFQDKEAVIALRLPYRT
jgi:stage 0 sporulation protein B (sporulation initiation phosphotransferase)